MQLNLSSSELSFRRWRQSLGDTPRDVGSIVEGIWKLLMGEWGDHDLEFGFFCLMHFVSSKRSRQNSLIKQACQRSCFPYWDTVISRSGSLYQRMKPHVQRLSQKRAQLDTEGFQKYLHKALEYNLLECNRECVLDLMDPRREVHDPEELEGLYGEYHGLVGVVDDPRGDKTLGEIIEDQILRSQAEQLGLALLEDWNQAQLNVLCHYCETFMGIHSGRLSGETRSNIDQLHSRVRRKFMGFLRDRGYDRDVARVFFETEMQKICQQCPVLVAYKIRNGVENDTLL